jgi:peptidoglycan hydrolase-like protein with peptidoglycan-binding domain
MYHIQVLPVGIYRKQVASFHSRANEPVDGVVSTASDTYYTNPNLV